MDVSRARASAIPKGVGVTPQGRIGVREFLSIILQLGLLMLVLRQFQIENSAFLQLALLTFAGFVSGGDWPCPWRHQWSLARRDWPYSHWDLSFATGFCSTHGPPPAGWRLARCSPR